MALLGRCMVGLILCVICSVFFRPTEATTISSAGGFAWTRTTMPNHIEQCIMQTIEMDLFDHFVWITPCRVLMLMSDLSDVPGSSGPYAYGYHGTTCELLYNSTLQNVHMFQRINSTGGEELWVAKKGFVVRRFYYNSDQSLDTTGKTDFYLTFLSRQYWWNGQLEDDSLFPDPVELTKFVVDSNDWVWVLMKMEGDNRRYRVYAADLTGSYKSGELFRVAPPEYGWLWYRQSMRDIVYFNNFVYSFNSYTFYFETQSLPSGSEVIDPWWGTPRQYTIRQLASGAGSTLEVRSFDRTGKVIELGASQVLTVYDPSDPHLTVDSVTILKIFRPTKTNKCRYMTIDPWRYYIFIHDLGMEESNPNSEDTCFYIASIDPLEQDPTVYRESDVYPSGWANAGYSASEMSYSNIAHQGIVQIAANGFAIFNTQDCATGGYASCDACVGTGGRYCVWNSTIQACQLDDEYRDLQICPVLLLPDPPSVSLAGESRIKLSSTGQFLDDLQYRCAFHYLNGTAVARFPATVSPDLYSVSCDTPPLPADSTNSTLLVGVLGYDEFLYVENKVPLNYYNCTVLLEECMERSDEFALCGWCYRNASCGIPSECSDNSTWIATNSTVPSVASIDPTSLPFDIAGDVIITVSEPAMLFPNFDYFCRWGGDPPEPSPYYKNASLLNPSDPSDQRLRCEYDPYVSGVFIHIEIEYSLGENGAKMQLTYDSVTLAKHHVCSSASDCASCISSERSMCVWCPYDDSCSADGLCTDSMQSNSCPILSDVSPAIIPNYHIVPLSLTVANIPKISNSSLLTCEFRSASSTLYSVPANFTPESTVLCDSPEITTGGTVDVNVAHSGSKLFKYDYSFSVYDCSSGLACMDCYTVGSLCGWCLHELRCSFESACSGNSSEPWIRDVDVCPKVTSLMPFQGVVDGGTELNVTVDNLIDIPENSSYFCSFLSTSGNENSTSIATVNNNDNSSSAHISCTSPVFFQAGFVQLSVDVNSTEYTSNSLSFIVFNCSDFSDSCQSCVVPRKAECGWCLSTNVCGPISACNSTNATLDFVTTSPVILKYGIRDGEMEFSVSMLPFDSDPDQWFCYYGSRKSCCRAYRDRGVVRCDIPDLTGHGSQQLRLTYKDVNYALSSSMSYSPPAETDDREIWGANWAGILCTLMTIGAMLIIVRIGMTVFFWGRTPVIRSASPFFCQLMLVGGMIGVCSNFAFIWGPHSGGACIARPWFASFSHVLIFGGLYAKTYRIYRIFHNPKLKRIRLRKRSLLFWISVFGFIDSLFLLIWSAEDPMDDVWIDKGNNVRVKRCSGDHTEIYQTIFFVYKVLFILVGCVLAFLTRSVPSTFNESKHIAVSMYSSIIVGVIGLPIVLFAGVPEEARVLLLTLCILWLTVGTLMVVFFPKMWIIHVRRSKNVMQTSAATKYASSMQKKYGKKRSKKRSKKPSRKGRAEIISERTAYVPPPIMTSDGRVLCSTSASLGDRGQESFVTDDEEVPFDIMRTTVSSGGEGEDIDIDDLAAKYGGGYDYDLPSYLQPDPDPDPDPLVPTQSAGQEGERIVCTIGNEEGAGLNDAGIVALNE